MSKTNPKEIAGSKKASMDVPPIAIAIEGQAVLDGELKYGFRNWRETPISYRKYIDAIKRHIALLEEGQDFASDSKIHHLGHIRATSGILLDAELCGTLIDDRAKKHTDVFNTAFERVHAWVVERRKKHAEQQLGK